jgi:two-component system chemotaxis sensor kinase CheA
MPHMDGFELTRTLKSHATLAHLPVIMITSLGSQEDIEQGMASGADAYVVKKNLTQHELVSTINQLL